MLILAAKFKEVIASDIAVNSAPASILKVSICICSQSLIVYDVSRLVVSVSKNAVSRWLSLVTSDTGAVDVRLE